jgi:hypothetical protein
MAARAWDSLHDRPYRTRPSSTYLRLMLIGRLQEAPLERIFVRMARH